MSKLTRRVCLARAALIKHVTSGGTLSGRWPDYVRGVPKNLGRGEARRAWSEADDLVQRRFCADLLYMALDNFYEGGYSAHHYDNGRSAY